MKYSLYISGGLLLILLLVPGAFFSFSSANDTQYLQNNTQLINAIEADRKSLFRIDAFRSLVFILIAFVCIWMVLKQKLKAQTALIIIGLAILVDMWTVNKRFFNNEHFVRKTELTQYYTPRPADQQILQDTTYYRVYDASNSIYSSYASYFHKSVTGYNAARLGRYEELIRHHIQRHNTNVFNMLNVKYFIVPDNAQQGGQGQPQVQLNPHAMGNAWFVDSIQFVSNADEEIEALNNFSPGAIAIVDERFRGQIDVNSIMKSDTTNASIELTSYHPEHLRYEYVSASDRVVVFSEIYYANGWKAYVDGKEHPHFRTDYVLRGMRLPAGKHMVEFKFHPTAYYAGEKVSLVSSILLGMLTVGVFYRERKKGRQI